MSPEPLTVVLRVAPKLAPLGQTALRPLVFGQHVRARLIALACTRPPDTPQGMRRERWTHRELTEQVGMSESQRFEKS